MAYRIAHLFIAIFTLVSLIGDQSHALEDVVFRMDAAAPQDMSQDIRAVSVLSSLKDNGAAAPDEIVTAAQGDYARILEYLYSKGYYAGDIQILLDGREAALIDPLMIPAKFEQAEILVDPGRLFRFGRLRIAPQTAGEPMPEGFAPNAPASAETLRTAAQTALSNWREAGHAKAQISRQSVLARHNQALLDVDLALDPGPPVRFGEVTVSGKTAVRENVIRRIAGLPRGDVFHPDAIAKAEARLRKTRTFNSVQVIEGENVAPDGSMDIEIAVVDQKPRRIGGGVEYSNFDGLTLSGYWFHRNFLGGAELFRVDAEVAQIDNSAVGTDYSLSFLFEKPAIGRPDTTLFAEADLARYDEPEYLVEIAMAELGISRSFNERLSATLGAGYSYARVTDRYVTPNTQRELQLFSLPFSMEYDARDDRLSPTKGFYLHGEIKPFYETNTAQSGARVKFDTRGYRALGGARGAVLAGRVQLGALVGPSAQDAPPDFLFYSGGGGTVRGQPYKSLAADYGGTTLGGRSFAGISAELRVPVSEQFGLVGFVDAGMISSGLFENGDWHAGAGVGLRYQTPVGPIRLDLAAPVAGDTGDGVQIYVGIGQAF